MGEDVITEVSVNSALTHETNFDFTQAEKEVMKPYVNELQKLLVYETSKIKEILAKLNCEQDGNLFKWKQEVEQALFLMHNEKYNKLVTMLD